MKKFTMGFVCGVLSVFVSIYLCIVLLVPQLANINQYKADLESFITKITRVECTIDSLDFDIDWALKTTLGVSSLKVANIEVVDNASVSAPMIDILTGKSDLKMSFISEIEDKLKSKIKDKKVQKEVVKEVVNDKLKKYGINLKF